MQEHKFCRIKTKMEYGTFCIFKTCPWRYANVENTHWN